MTFKKWLFGALAALALAGPLEPSFAADPVKEQTIDQVGVPTALSVGTIAWTKVPKQLDLRAGTIITNPLNSGATVYGILWTSTSTTQVTPAQASISTATFTLELVPGDNPLIVNGATVDIWLVANTTGTVKYQEVSQNLKIR